MESLMENSDDIRHIGDEVGFAGYEGLDLRNNLPVSGFFRHNVCLIVL